MSRITKILLAVLALQLIIWGLLSIDRNVVKEKQNFLASDTGAVNFIHIKNKDGEVTLKKVGGAWRVAEPYNYQANPSYMNTLLKKLAELQFESLITTKKDKYVDYEVEGDEAAYVEVGVEGAKIDKFYCGKPSKTYTHTYMRPADSDEVWLVAGTPRSSFTRKPGEWRDKKIIDLDKNMIERILIKFPDEVVEVRRQIASPLTDSTLVSADTSWQVIPQRGKPFAPSDKIMNRIRNTAGKMNAMEFKVSGKDTIPDFSKPDLTVEIFLEGDQREVLDFVPDTGEENRYIVRKNGDMNTVFVVYQSTFKNLAKRPDDFIEKETGEGEEF